MKIIAKDNFDREGHSDRLICENVNKYMGERICNLLNTKEGEDSPNYYVTVEDEYKLYEFEP